VRFGIPQTERAAGGVLRCLTNSLEATFRPDRVSARGTLSVRFGLQTVCMAAGRRPSFPFREYSCCDELGSLPVEKLV
jgi:hypothetical protein